MVSSCCSDRHEVTSEGAHHAQEVTSGSWARLGRRKRAPDAGLGKHWSFVGSKPVSGVGDLMCGHIQGATADRAASSCPGAACDLSPGHFCQPLSPGAAWCPATCYLLFSSTPCPWPSDCSREKDCQRWSLEKVEAAPSPGKGLRFPKVGKE